MNILITGGESFIARSIKASPLFAEHTLFTPSHAELDVTLPIMEYVVNNKIDYIMHTAVNKQEAKYAFNENVLMLANVLECSPGVRGILCFGSGIEYCYAYAREKAKQHYQAFKLMQKSYIQSSGYENISTIKIYGVFGPLEDESRFTSDILNQSTQGSFIYIERNRIFTYTYIDDILEVIKTRLDNIDKMYAELQIPYCVGSLLGMAYIIKKMSHSFAPIIVNEEEEGAPYTPHSSEYIQLKDHDYFADGIRKMIEARKACIALPKE